MQTATLPEGVCAAGWGTASGGVLCHAVMCEMLSLRGVVLCFLQVVVSCSAGIWLTCPLRHVSGTHGRSTTRMGRTGMRGVTGRDPSSKVRLAVAVARLHTATKKQRFMCVVATCHRCTDLVWCCQFAPAVHSSDMLQHCEYWQWVPDATFVGKCLNSDSSWQQVGCADGASTAATKLLLCVCCRAMCCCRRPWHAGQG
jgi:hypothetical protein